MQLTKFLAKFREKEREEAMVGWWVWYIPGDIMLHVIYGTGGSPIGSGG